jgi:excisionase family DNA binding protein
MQTTQGNNAHSDDWLTLQQAANRAHCHEATVRRLIKAGLLRHARVGAGRKHIRIRACWLDAAMEACATPIEVR